MTAAVMRAGVGIGRRVVRRADAVGVVHASVDERIAKLVALLEEWAQWDRSYRERLGFQPKAAGLSSGGIWHRADSILDGADDVRMKIVETCVHELPPAQGAALLRRYGLAGVFRFPRLNYEQVLSDAHDALLVMLPKKGVDIV